MSDKTKLAFLDIETTGLDPFRHEIVEVAVIKRCQPHPGSDVNLHFSLNIDPTRAEPKALEVNRYYEREKELADMQVSDALASFVLFRSLLDAVIIGNNPQFDLRFIEQFLKRNAFSPAGVDFTPTPWNYHPVDLKALVAGRLGLGEPPWSTKQIAEAAGVPLPEDAHSAFADAAWNRDLYDAVMNYEPARLPNGSVNPARGTLRQALNAPEVY